MMFKTTSLRNFYALLFFAALTFHCATAGNQHTLRQNYWNWYNIAYNTDIIFPIALSTFLIGEFKSRLGSNWS